jgi:hypothetical protein
MLAPHIRVPCAGEPQVGALAHRPVAIVLRDCEGNEKPFCVRSADDEIRRIAFRSDTQLHEPADSRFRARLGASGRWEHGRR